MRDLAPVLLFRNWGEYIDFYKFVCQKALKELMLSVDNIPIDQIESNVIQDKIILHQKKPNLSNNRRKDDQKRAVGRLILK